MILDNLETNYAGKCIRCGLCMSVCPVYQVSLDESDVARGKMALLEWEQNHSKIKQSKRFKQSISRCLLCGACAQVCPIRLTTHDRIQKMRQRITSNIKEKFVMTTINALSQHNRSGKIFRTSSAILQKCVGKRIIEQSGLHLRFPLNSMSHRKYIPKINPIPFAQRYPLAPNSHKKILYFTGCGTNYIFNQTGQALIEILQENNLTPYVPENQVCCGLPFYAAGDRQNAEKFAKHNIDIIDKISPDIILTTCASCGSQIHQWKKLLQKDPKYNMRATKIANLHKDATAFILENVLLRKIVSSQNNSVLENIWYHHPCHMRWGETKLPVPKKLFSSFDQVNVIYSNNQCCGNGGKFQISHFDLSMKIFDQRIDLFKEQKIDRVLTSCTGCHLQFLEGVLQNKMSVSVMHPLEWIYRMTTGESKKK